MPEAIRTEASRRLSGYIASQGGTEAARLGQLLAAWEKGDPVFASMLGKFLQFTRDLDASRSQHFSNTFPDLQEMLYPVVIS